MSKFEDISVERDYPWLARFTENILRDAPSQFNAYYLWLPKYQDKKYGLRKEVMARVHESFIPYYNDLVNDLLEEGEDRMSVWDKRKMKSSSSGKTTEDTTSNKNKSPERNQGNIIPMRTPNRVQRRDTFLILKS